jgi:5,6,7,8-tetrahydromethanopterin hydro-lyase
MDSVCIGEYFSGDGAEAAHTNVVLGPKSGPVGAAFIQGLANPKPGHLPFLVVMRPGVAVKPFTLFVNKADIRGKQHETATWGAAQAGVAQGIWETVESGVLEEDQVDEILVLACVWVDWRASDLGLVYANNRVAVRGAVERALRGSPSLAEVADAAVGGWNPFYRPAG